MTIYPTLPKPERYGKTTKTEWLQALARYEKASGALVTEPEPDTPTFCCLGVLAREDDALVKEPIAGDWYLWLEIPDSEEYFRETPGWCSPSEDLVEEVYGFHPTLEKKVQALLATANDATERFEDLVIPLIDVLLNEDLTLRTDIGAWPTNLIVRMNVTYPSLQDSDKRGKALTLTNMIERMHEGVSMVKALSASLPIEK